MKIKSSAEIRTITPKEASDLLQNKWEEQRTIRQRAVTRMAHDMETGNWKMGPDAILVVQGKLANGQHRMSAVVECGKPQQFLVMESNDEELYKVIDGGLKRTVADALIGFKYAALLPSIARWVKAYDNGAIARRSKNSQQAQDMTRTEHINYCISKQSIFELAAEFVMALYGPSRLLPASIGGALYVIGTEKKIAKTSDFLTAVYTDQGQSAATDLRSRLISNKGAKTQLSHGYIFGITLKAFKSYINGTRPGTLKWVEGEQLPCI